MITIRRSLSLLIPAFGFVVLSANAVSAQGVFQGWAANQQINAIQQGLRSGLITPGQATDLMNHANDLAAREQKLLRNDGGVLTPNDSSKIMQNLVKEGQRLQDAISNNGYTGATGYGTGATGITGLLSSLLGINNSPALSSYGYGGVTGYPGATYGSAGLLNGYLGSGYVNPAYPAAAYPAAAYPAAAYVAPSYYGNTAYQPYGSANYYGANRSDRRMHQIRHEMQEQREQAADHSGQFGHRHFD